jgi:hypothetical protein
MTDDLRTQLESKTDDQLVEMLRDRERGDYRPEALAIAEQIIAARGLALPPPEAPAADPGDVEFVTVATFLTTGEAEPARNALTAAGFHVLARDMATIYADGVLSPMLGGVKMQVPAEEAAEAAEFLRQANAGELATPLECPACSSAEADVTETTAGRMNAAANFMIARVAIPDREVRFRCRSCGHDWQ